MICADCFADMSHQYCESWTENEDHEEYVTTVGYWHCYVCAHQVRETDEEYYEPEDN